jgi:hypothetical protein
MPITMHPATESRLRARAEAEGMTVEQYVEQLMRAEDAEIANTEALLREGADSGDYIELNEQEWDRMESEAVAKANSKQRA